MLSKILRFVKFLLNTKPLMNKANAKGNLSENRFSFELLLFFGVSWKSFIKFYLIYFASLNNKFMLSISIVARIVPLLMRCPSHK